ncbi:hypothetical protein VP01_162g10 [Puccinia sorghi]|uniref:Uncharacterized protein n=1 Tax=Puccinia sorghi TaxID=27349 RepID=A0A0L6VGZ2_9BASI|nr:hypothetical protein VP01_162g10 [Puccinia sorghi]
MAAMKAATNREKAASKEAQQMIKKDEASKDACFVWTKAASLELLHFYRMVKGEHTSYRNDQDLRPFRNFFWPTRLMSNFSLYSLGSPTQASSEVKDIVYGSGRSVLLAALVNNALCVLVWDLLLDIHGDDAAANAYGYS